MPSVKDELDKFGGIGPGFNFWRFLLSSLIVFLHSFFVCYGIHSEISGQIAQWGRPIFMGILPIFFGLSGFLVAASAERSKNVFTFLSLRALRLVPALAVETTLAALVLGPILTAYLLPDYFTDHRFFAYFGNIIGRVRYELPGMFAQNPVPNTINLNLWTLHAELECYALMAVAIVLGMLRRRKLLLLVWIAASAVLVALNASHGMMEPTSLYPTSVFVFSFCTAVVAYLWRDQIPVSRNLFLLAVLGYCVVVWLPQTFLLSVILLTYIMIYVGLAPQLNFSWLSKGDYSYGIYLYSFVVQQTIVYLIPAAREWWIVFPTALLATLAFAVFSWHCIEKPALRLKQFVAAKRETRSGNLAQKAPQLRTSP